MSGIDPSVWEFHRGVHLLTHLLVEKGRTPWPAALMVLDCWAYPLREVPDWAAELAEANAPGWQWCPLVNEELAPEVWAEAKAWQSVRPWR